MFYLCHVKHSEIKQHIIETASSLFYQNGYNSTGINEIIAQAGIAKATLYNHFKSKEDICLAYLQFKNTTFLRDINLHCKKEAAGRDQVLALFDFLNIFFEDSDFNGCWCIKTVAEIPKENERIKAEIQMQKHHFLNLIATLVNDNLAHAEDQKVETLSRQIYLLYESAVSESHLHQADWPIMEARKICEQIIG